MTSLFDSLLTFETNGLEIYTSLTIRTEGLHSQKCLPALCPYDQTSPQPPVVLWERDDPNWPRRARHLYADPTLRDRSSIAPVLVSTTKINEQHRWKWSYDRVYRAYRLLDFSEGLDNERSGSSSGTNDPPF